MYMYIVLVAYAFACGAKVREASARKWCLWAFVRGGCSRRGVQWIGVVLYSKIVYNIIQITTPCFHCSPLCRM